MSLAGLLNKSFVLYRKTPAVTYPPTDTWASAGTIACYVSDKKITTVLSDGTHVQVRVKRFRTEPYTLVDGDRIYYNSHVYETTGDGLGYENFDELDMEAVTIGQIMDDSVIADMGIV
jgi:hypothetical protein